MELRPIVIVHNKALKAAMEAFVGGAFTNSLVQRALKTVLKLSKDASEILHNSDIKSLTSSCDFSSLNFTRVIARTFEIPFNVCAFKAEKFRVLKFNLN